jgi:hypothetical protein
VESHAPHFGKPFENCEDSKKAVLTNNGCMLLLDFGTVNVVYLPGGCVHIHCEQSIVYNL